MTSLLQWGARFVHFWFWYCTDFMVNFANRTHSTYTETNTWVLLILLPGLLTLLVGIRVAQWFHIRRLNSRRPTSHSLVKP